MTTIGDEFGEIDPAERGARRRRWPIAVAAGAIVTAVVLIALIANADGDRRGSPTDDRLIPIAWSPPVIAAAESDMTPAAAPYVLPEPPDGYAPLWVSDPRDQPPVELPDVRWAIFAADGADVADGNWISIEVEAGAGSVPAALRVRERSAQPQTRPDEVSIGGIEGAFGETFDHSDMLVFGPVGDDLVSITSSDVPREQLVRIAASIRLIDGTPVVDRAGLGELRLVSTGKGSPWFDQGSTVVYGSSDMSDNLFITVAEITESAPLARSRFRLIDAKDVDIGGEPGVAGTVGQQFGQLGLSSVVWETDGRLFSVSGTLPADDLVAMAQTAVMATDDELADLRDAAAEFQAAVNEQPGDDITRLGAFMVGAGNLADRQRWRIEASFDEGSYQICFDSGIGGTGCRSGPAPELPLLELVSDFTFHGVVAVVDQATADEHGPATLRLTPEAGAAVTIELRPIDPTFPGPAAAHAVATEMGFTAEVLTGDGTVIESIDVSGT